MKKFFLFTVVGMMFFFSGQTFARDLSFDDLLRNCADEICEGIDGKVKNLAVIDVETQYWALSDYIVDELNHWFIKKLVDVNVVTRDEFVKALTNNEIKYSQTGEVTDETIQEFARLGFDCIVKGTFSDVSGGYQLIVTALNTESLKQFASWKEKIKAKDADVKYLIEKSKKNERPVVKINKKTVVQDGGSSSSGYSNSSSSSKTPLGVSACMINENGQTVSTLHPGDIIRFKVSADKNVYLAILCIDAQKNEEWLPLQSNYLRAGESRIFPDIPGAVLRVENGIFGNESVKVYAATVESDLPGQGKMMGTRAFVLANENSQTAETVIEYRVSR